MTVTINGTTGIAGVDGSASTPASQGTDTNTGIFYPAADTVGVSTGGTERMRIDSSGNVGIGTSSPAGKLDIALTTGRILFQTSSGVNYITSLNSALSGGQDLQINANLIQFLTGGTEKAKVAANGDFSFNSGYGSAAVAYGCRAWVQFDGTTASPSTIRASGNVSSVTKNGTAQYTLNFSSSLVDANYSVIGMCGTTVSGTSGAFVTNGAGPSFTVSNTTSSCRVDTRYQTNAYAEYTHVSVAVFR